MIRCKKKQLFAIRVGYELIFQKLKFHLKKVPIFWTNGSNGLKTFLCLSGHILCDPLVINQRVTAVWRKKAKNKIKWGGSSVVSDKLEEWRKQKLVEIKRK